MSTLLPVRDPVRTHSDRVVITNTALAFLLMVRSVCSCSWIFFVHTLLCCVEFALGSYVCLLGAENRDTRLTGTIITSSSAAPVYWTDQFYIDTVRCVTVYNYRCICTLLLLAWLLDINPPTVHVIEFLAFNYVMSRMSEDMNDVVVSHSRQATH